MKKLKIFIVDDDPIVAKIVSAVIERTLDQWVVGADITIAENSTKAIQIVEETKDAFDLLVVDLNCPERNAGFDVIRSVKGKMPDCTCTILTGRQGSTLVSEGWEAGACYFLQKPDFFYQLKEILEEVSRKIIEEKII